MLDQQDGRSEFPTDSGDQSLEFLLFGRIHAGGRLVQQEKAGPRRQRTNDLQAPLIPVGKAATRQGGGLLQSEIGQQTTALFLNFALFGTE